MKTSNRNIYRNLLFLFGFLIVLYGLSSWFYVRLDLTSDQRYTLSAATKNIISQAGSPVVIDVLLKGSFPPEFRKLQDETRQLLEEFAAENSNIKYSFIDPSDDDATEIHQSIEDFGLMPAQVSVMEGGKQSVEIIFPYALAHYEGKSVSIPLLKNQLGSTSEERVQSSIQNLQYAFADGLKKLVTEKSKKIAVIKGNGELDDRFIFDFFSTLREYYFTAPFTLDSVATKPIETLRQLKTFDLIVIAKPTESFTEEQKYVLDQYLMHGGKALWLIDMIQLHTDSQTGKMFAFSMDLNLNDFFFRYGLRINPNLLKDVYSAPIVLATGEDRESQYERYPWFFSPLSSSQNNHPIVANIEAVKFDYASAIDTLENSIQKTILLSSSPISKIVGVPYEIDLDVEIPEFLQVVNEGPNPNQFNAGEVPLAVLMEGSFTSVYKNRVKPFKDPDELEEGKNTKIIVISDGDVIKNQLQGKKPLELGFDRMTNSFYGNKEFLLNSVNYLLDDTGLINIRSKQINIPFLDPIATIENRNKYQLLNLVAPLLFLAAFGLTFNFLRKKRNKVN